MSEQPNGWSNSQLLQVCNAIYSDQGFAANTIACPVCGEDALDYEQFSFADAVAWCRTCKTGYKQGDGIRR